MEEIQGSSHLLFIWLLMLFAPLTFAVAAVADMSQALSKSRASFTKKKRLESTSRRKKILITGINNSTALALARVLKEQDHEVIGADFEDVAWLSSGRWSRSLRKYYSIGSREKKEDGRSNELVNGTNGTVQSAAEEHHMRSIERIAKSNSGVDLWIPFDDTCISAATVKATARRLKQSYGTDVIFYNAFIPVEENGSSEDGFLAFVREYLPSSKVRPPQIVPVQSRDEIHRALRRYPKGSHWILRNTLPIFVPPKALTNGNVKHVRFDLADTQEREPKIVKLPEATNNETYDTISRIRIGKTETWYLCETQPQGKNYVSHALIRGGKLRTFSLLSDLGKLQNFHRSLTPVEPSAGLYNILLDFNKYLAKVISDDGARELSTHFSIEYVVQECLDSDGIALTITATTFSPYPNFNLTISTLDRKTWPALANAYTSNPPTTKNADDILTLPSSSSNDTAIIYTLPLLFFTTLVVPVIDLLLLRGSLLQLAQSALEAANTVVYGKEELFAWEDPWVFWWYWHVSMPVTVAASFRRFGQQRALKLVTDSWGDGLRVWRKALGGKSRY